jgi:hypothetical protein
MRKLLVVAAVVAGTYAAWHWHQPDVESATRNLALNRLWIDHMPTGERDPFNVFVAHAPPGFGGFAQETQWHGQMERFRFDIEGNVIHAVFPWSRTREDITLRARPCHEHDMDYCLDVSGSSHGVARYYSLVGWERKDGEDADQLVSRVLGHLY